MKKLTEKQIKKLQSKKEREELTKIYLDEIQSIVDREYINLSIVLEDFNKELEEGSLKYSYIINQINTLLNEGYMDFNLLETVMIEISEMENRNDELYTLITSRDLKQNKILRHIPSIAEQVSEVVLKAETELKGHKNQAYICSMVLNRSFDVFKSYNNYIIDTALESNDYIDMYIDSRENFLDFIEKCKKDIATKMENLDDSKHSEVIIEENIKYNQRLRVEYSDLTKFLKHKGYECNRQGSTTHAVWKHKETGHSVPLPNKSGTIPQGTTSKVLKQIGSSRNELAQYLYA
jgi:predicted RNA binding protein YcfA (HicA-like mRNA interferase family)